MPPARRRRVMDLPPHSAGSPAGRRAGGRRAPRAPEICRRQSSTLRRREDLRALTRGASARNTRSLAQPTQRTRDAGTLAAIYNRLLHRETAVSNRARFAHTFYFFWLPSVSAASSRAPTVAGTRSTEWGNKPVLGDKGRKKTESKKEGQRATPRGAHPKERSHRSIGSAAHEAAAPPLRGNASRPAPWPWPAPSPRPSDAHATWPTPRSTRTTAADPFPLPQAGRAAGTVFKPTPSVTRLRLQNTDVRQATGVDRGGATSSPEPRRGWSDAALREAVVASRLDALDGAAPR